MDGTNLVASVPVGKVAFIVLAVASIVASTAGLSAAKLNLVISFAELLGSGVGVGVGVITESSFWHESAKNTKNRERIFIIVFIAFAFGALTRRRHGFIKIKKITSSLAQHNKKTKKNRDI